MRAPLSYNQEFLAGFDRGEAEGAFGDRHTLVHGWRIRGEIALDALRAALFDVVARHEALRTSVVRADGSGYQRIEPPTHPPLLVRDLPADDPATRDRQAEELVNEVDAAPLPVRDLPHLRVVLGRFSAADAVLVLATHHTATDPWSLQVIMRDLSACYTARLAGEQPNLAQIPQYADVASWQREQESTPPVLAARRYWREKLRGAEILAIPADRPRPAGIPNAFAAYRFLVDSDLTAAVLARAWSARCSPFMVLLAAYQVLLHRRSGVADLTVPIFTAGRGEERFHDTVGMFVNFVPIRTDLTGAMTLYDVLRRTRASCLEAYTYDIPFPLIAREAPDLGRQFALDDHTVVTFELLQSAAVPTTSSAGGLPGQEIRRRLLSQPVSSHIPDGGLWAMDVLPSGEMVGSLKYNSNLLDGGTAAGLVSGFRAVLRAMAQTPDLPLRHIRE